MALIEDYDMHMIGSEEDIRMCFNINSSKEFAKMLSDEMQNRLVERYNANRFGPHEEEKEIDNIFDNPEEVLREATEYELLKEILRNKDNDYIVHRSERVRSNILFRVFEIMD